MQCSAYRKWKFRIPWIVRKYWRGNLLRNFLVKCFSSSLPKKQARIVQVSSGRARATIQISRCQFVFVNVSLDETLGVKSPLYSGSCPRTWDMPEIFLGDTWDFLIFAWDMIEIYLRYNWDMPRICLRYTWFMYKICEKYAWDLP